MTLKRWQAYKITCAASMEKNTHAAAAHLMMSQSFLDLMITSIEWLAIAGGFLHDRHTCG